MNTSSLRRLVALSFLALSACGGGGGGGGGPTSPTQYSIGGTVTGLNSGANVVLQVNGGNNLSVTTNGSFTFATPLATGTSYSVSVLTQPTNQNCTVAGGSPWSQLAAAFAAGVIVALATVWRLAFWAEGGVGGIARFSVGAPAEGGGAHVAPLVQPAAPRRPLPVLASAVVSVLELPFLAAATSFSDGTVWAPRKK